MTKSQDNPALGLIHKMERKLRALRKLNEAAEARLDAVETRLDKVDPPGP